MNNMVKYNGQDAEQQVDYNHCSHFGKQNSQMMFSEQKTDIH